MQSRGPESDPSRRNHLRDVTPRRESDIRRAAVDVIRDVFHDAIPEIRTWVKERKGLLSRGDVKGRENEDPELVLDIEAEKEIVKVGLESGKKHGLPLLFYSEHNNYDADGNPIKKSDSEERKAIMLDGQNRYFKLVIDPIDNSDELGKGLDRFYVGPWSVVAIYGPDNKPLAAGACNLNTGEGYMHHNGRNYYHDITDKRPTNDIPFKPTKTVNGIKTDSRLVVASYRARWKYDGPFTRDFTQFNQDRDPKSTLISTGGNYLFVPLALGDVNVYVAPNEPLEELFAGLPFILGVKGEVRIINSDNTYSRLTEFDPGRQKDRALLALVSADHYLLDEVLEYYIKARQRQAEEGALIEKLLELGSSQEVLEHIAANAGTLRTIYNRLLQEQV
ncbi:MAG: hypothetical protein M1450_04315 [Patescibacteria group bacterium]|nr:hypothetical protein [Patescibacteria group bacterium]